MVLYYAETDGTSNGHANDTVERALVEARSQLEEEAQDIERAVSEVAIEVYSYMKSSAKYSKLPLMRSSVMLNI